MLEVIGLPSAPQGPRSRLLIVDDDAGMRENLAELFGSLGYDVRTAADARQALEALEEEPFDLLLTDYKMPGPTGIELIAAARSRWPSLRAVLMTAFGDSVTAAEGVRHGAAGYVSKPFEADEIVAFVERLLSGSGT